MTVFTNYDAFLSLRIVFTLKNSVDPDKIANYAAFHLGFHYLYLLQYQRGFQYTKG